MTVAVVGVHGVRNHQGDLEAVAAGQKIAQWWHAAVLKGFKRSPEVSPFEMRVAYYAHCLHTRTSQGDEDLQALDAAVQDDILAWARLHGADKPTVQGWPTAPARAAVSWVATKFGLDHAAARAFAAAFFPEVWTYFNDAQRREQARACVAEAIEVARPRILIAHSLGSVVAYETLWVYEHPPIDLLITFGSPLAMPHLIYDRLAPHEGERRRPPGVARWINIADPGDIIAIPPKEIPVRFAGVTADLTDAIGAFSYHRVTGYLANPVTAGILATHL